MPLSQQASPPTGPRRQPLSSVCVFCASRNGVNPAFGQDISALAARLAHERIVLVYGGAQVGMMGRLANAVLRHGGEVVGVMPKSMAEMERAHPNLTQMVMVDSMQARKEEMMQRSDGCLTLAGGTGTLDEFFEAWTAAYLGTYPKPVGLANTAGFYTHLLAQLDHQNRENMLSELHYKVLCVGNSAVETLEKMQAFARADKSLRLPLAPHASANDPPAFRQDGHI